MAEYAEQHFEWVRGWLVKMPAVSLKHDNLTGYLRELIRAYFAFNPIGQVTGDPFVMQLDDSRRQPDLQIVLNTNPGQLTDTAMIGPADICNERGCMGVPPGNSPMDRPYAQSPCLILEEHKRAGRVP